MASSSCQALSFLQVSKERARLDSRVRREGRRTYLPAEPDDRLSRWRTRAVRRVGPAVRGSACPLPHITSMYVRNDILQEEISGASFHAS